MNCSGKHATMLSPAPPTGGTPRPISTPRTPAGAHPRGHRAPHGGA
jgi:hypothetical protein